MSNNNDAKALKSGVWYVLCNFIVKGAVFLSTPLFTRLMTTEDIGAFSNVTAWVNILTIITSLELASSITFAYFEYKNNLNEFIASILVLSSTVTIAFYIVVLLFKDFFMQLFSVDFITLNIIFTYCLVCPALQMIQVKNRVLFEYKSSTILSFASVLISILASLLFVLILPNKLFGRVLGYFGSLILFNFAIYIYILSKSGHIQKKYWKFALMVSIPMIVHVLSGQLLSSCDRVMITNMCGAEKNALYSIAYTCATVISVLWNSLNTAWSPWAYEQMNLHKNSRLKRASKPYIILFLFIVLCFLLISPELLLLMGGESYVEAVAVIPPVVIGMFYQFVYSLYVNIEFFHKKQKYTATGTAIATLVNIGLNWLMIPTIGYVAAAYTTLIGYMVLFGIHYFIVSKMGKANWYDTKFNFLVLAFSLLLLPICNFLYLHTAIRYSIIFVIVLICIGTVVKYGSAIISCVKLKSIKPLARKFHN